MTIRTYGGKPLLVGGHLATADDCCCGDGPEQGPCESCLDDCFCVHMHGYNFCDGDYLEITDCGSPAAGCTQEIWQYNAVAGLYSYSRSEFGPPPTGGAAQNNDFYQVTYRGPPSECSQGQWSVLTLESFAEEGRDDPVNPVRRTNWFYNTQSIVNDANGCPISVSPGGYESPPSGFPPTQDITPLTPDITFTPCPPGEVEFLSLAARPGTELKALLASFGITASPTCPCNKMAAQMNAWGPDESLNRIEQIVDVMQKTAAARRLPFLRAVGRKLVRIACARARKKSAQTGQ